MKPLKAVLPSGISDNLGLMLQWTWYHDDIEIIEEEK